MSALMGTSDPGLVAVLESHAVVAAFWMREATESRGLSEDLAQQVSDLQEAERSTDQQLATATKAVRDYRNIEVVLEEKLEHAEGLAAKFRGERDEAEKKALTCLESINAESARLREMEQHLKERDQELAAVRAELEKAQGAADCFAQEIINNPADGSGESLRKENEQMKVIIRKTKAHIARVDKCFADEPEKALTALTSARKLLDQAPAA